MIGSSIVPLLLAAPENQVWLLIRSNSDAELAQRIFLLRQYWAIDASSEAGTRLHFLRGDAATPHFSLDEAQYDALVTRCSHIIHCAGTVRMNLSLEEARRSAVGSAQEILHLARRCAEAGTLAKVDFVSTVGVAGKRRGIFTEEWLTELPEFHNTYEQAKAEAEMLVHEAVETEGLPITVHRPSMVIGNSSDGRVIHFQIFYFICEFLSGRRTAGLFPDFGATRLDIIPSDAVATAIVDASQDPSTSGRILHLCSGPEFAPRLEEVKIAVRQSFSRRGLSVPAAVNLPVRWFSGMAKVAARLAPARHRKALATLPIYLEYLADRQAFSNTRFVEWFASHDRHLPRWQDYLPRVLDHYLEQRQ